MDNKQRIKELYFEKKLNMIEIANDLKISKQYISKILRQDNRFIIEKENRKQNSIAKQKTRNIECIKKTRQKNREEKENENAILKLKHQQASRELSKGPDINVRALLKWNSSIYEYKVESKVYRMRQNFENKVSYVLPKKIIWK